MLLFTLPSFGVWMPHVALEALYLQQKQHHGAAVDSHEHHGHEHDFKSDISHSIHFDVVTYFKDYLHVDLKHPQQTSLDAPSFDSHPVIYAVLPDTSIQSLVLASSNQIQGPPDYRWLSSYPKTPIYLSTQRLRI